MNEIVKEFNGSKVRIVEKDGIHWFVAKDICKYFGDSDHKRSISRLDKDEISWQKSRILLGVCKMQQWSMSRDFIISCSTSSLNRHVARMGGRGLHPRSKSELKK